MMSKPHVLSSEESVAHGAALSQVELVSYQKQSSKIVNAMKKIHACSYLENTSFSSATNAALGGSIGGRRSLVAAADVSTGVSSLSYLRLPVVIASSGDVLSAAGSGALVFMPESNIDVIESIVQAYKACEDPRVMLPAVVNIDISNFSESVQLPNETYTRRFVGKFAPPVRFDKKPVGIGLIDGNHSEYLKQQQKAMKNSIETMEKVSLAWKKKFYRQLPLIEPYKADDADFILVVSGFHSTTAKAAVNKLRAGGKKAGLLRLRVVRPWPADAIKNALRNAKKVAVFDQSVSIGTAGTLYSDIKLLANFCSDYISLGKYPSEKNFTDIFTRMEKSEKEEIVWL